MKATSMILDLILSPFTYVSALWLMVIKRMGWQRAKLSEKIFMKVGVLPVWDHYYHPLINPRKHLKESLRNDRPLTGIDFNENCQLALLEKFNYAEELKAFPLNRPQELGYFYNNDSFGSGDSEYLYNMIRHFKPARIIEIGSGNSTLIAVAAIKANRKENAGYNCEHICIEPYEQPWLEQTNARIIRKKAEDLEVDFFKQLNENDILFIDSSHVIRPQGDVVFEYLTILPVLNPGVLVHIHDIFSPKDYLDEWVYNIHLLWNEQYLLEGFLTMNDKFEIIGALNYLRHHHRDAMARKCPVFAEQLQREPGSFWIRRK